MKSSSCALQVAWLLGVLSLGRTELLQGESCTIHNGTQGVCTSIHACPGVREQIVTGNMPQTCTIVNQVPIVCCNSGVNTATTTTIATEPELGIGPEVTPTPTATTIVTEPELGIGPEVTPTPTTTTIATEPELGIGPEVTPTPTTTTTTPRRSTSMVDETTVAGRKCVEYASHVHRLIEVPTPFGTKETYNISDCTMAYRAFPCRGYNEAEPNEYPHMAALGYGATEGDIQWKCGGSLISERFVLTAAHCLSDGHFDVSWVRLGDLDLSTSDDNVEPVTIPVIERIRHEGYKPTALYNDIALLKLDRDVTFSPYIRPVCLNTVPGNPLGKREITACGWGKLRGGDNSGSKKLMKEDLEIQDESLCNHTYRAMIRRNRRLKNGITPESMICASNPRGEKETCGGDSGGPIQIRLESPDPFCMYSVIGVVSFGTSSCYEGGVIEPVVYTRVSYYIPWIEQHVWPVLGHDGDGDGGVV